MIKINIKKRLSVISLIFGMIPLVIVFWLGVKSGLAANGEFQNGIALALMAAIFLGLFSSGLVRYWFFGKQLEKIKSFCLAVKDGRYDVFLPVPNEASDVEDENEVVELMRNMNGMAHQIRFNEIQLQAMVANLEQSQEKIASQNVQGNPINVGYVGYDGNDANIGYNAQEPVGMGPSPKKNLPTPTKKPKRFDVV